MRCTGYQPHSCGYGEYISYCTMLWGSCLAVAIHPVFLSATGAGYYLYRRSTRQTREKEAATDDAEEASVILKELQKQDQELREKWAELTKNWPEKYLELENYFVPFTVPDFSPEKVPLEHAAATSSSSGADLLPNSDVMSDDFANVVENGSTSTHLGNNKNTNRVT